MATQNPTLPAFFNTDADFRTWGLGINTALGLLGLGQTADTGQVNWTTVTKPAGTNTSQGYEIWRFNDALQATVPVFIKIEYGSGGATDRPAFWLTVGTGTNGTGTINSQVGTRFQITAGSSKSAGITLPSFLTGGTGRLAGIMNYDSGSSSFAITFLIERTRNSSGAPTGDAIITLYAGSSSTGQMQMVFPSGSNGGVQTTVAQTCPAIRGNDQGGRTIEGTNVGLWPLMVLDGQVFYASLMVAYKTTDITSGTPITADMFGTSHTWMPMGSVGTPAGLQAGGSSSNSIAILWE